MAEDVWFYAVAGKRQEPVSLAELQAMVANGRVPADSLVWTEGMAQWAAVSSVPSLRVSNGRGASGIQAAMPVEMAAPESVAYYNPSGGMPPRAATNLQGHARPLGDTGDWPLDDLRVGQFQSAVNLRKRVTSAAGLYRALLLLTTIAGVIVIIGGLAALAGPGRGTSAAGIGILVAAAAITGFAVLYWFTWKATMKSQRWAPLTMFIIYLVGFVLEILAMVFGSMAGNNAGPMIASNLISLVFAGAFAAVSWRSFKAIPEYLATPAWCQELLVKANL